MGDKENQSKFKVGDIVFSWDFNKDGTIHAIVGTVIGFDEDRYKRHGGLYYFYNIKPLECFGDIVPISIIERDLFTSRDDLFKWIGMFFTRKYVEVVKRFDKEYNILEGIKSDG